MLKKIWLLIITASIVFQILAFISCAIEDDDHPEESDQLTTQQKLLIEQLNDWLNESKGAYTLYLPPIDLRDNDLNFLDLIGKTKIIALGEATHGTKEFFQMKHRIFQYLVENFQHKAFGFEADFAESLYFDNYIWSGEGDLEELMKTKMHFWTWCTEEVKELLEWMKDYNTVRKEEEKIHYYGFDCQYTTYQPELIQDYLERTLPFLWDILAPMLEQVQNLTNEDYKSMSQETYEDILMQLESLENQLVENRDMLIANSSSREYEINRQLLKTFKQAFIVRYHYYGSPEDNRTNWRDLFMAENAQWIAGLFGQDSRITLWAHNGHVAKDASYGSSGSMGHHLYNDLGSQYKVVAFSFSQGSFTAVGQDQNGNYTGQWTHEITTEPQNNSINFIFHRVMRPNFAFHLDEIPAMSYWGIWLESPRPLLSVGAVYNGVPSNYYRTIDLLEYFNWIIHLDQTTASERILRY